MPVESKTFFGIIALGVIGVSSFGFWNYFSSKKCDKSDEKEPVNKSQTKVKSDENQVKDAEILSPESVSGSKKVDSNNETKKVDSNKKPALIPASKPPPQTISYASAAAKNTPPSPVKASPVSVVVMPPALQLDEKTLDPIHPSEKYLDAIHPSEGNVSSFLFKGADGQTHSVYTLLPNFEIPFTTLHHSSLKSNNHHDDDEEGENKEKESLQKKKLDPKVKQNGGIAPQGQQNGHHVDEPMDKSEKETKHTEKTQTESITIYTDVSHESCTETTTDCAESEVTEILVDSENVDDAKDLLSIENVSENLLAPVENNQTNASSDSSSAENGEIIIADNSQQNVQVESNDTPQPCVIQEENIEPVQEVEQSNQQPPAKKSSFNVAAYEFVPSYQYYQAPYTASGTLIRHAVPNQ